jgi:arginase
MHAKPTLVGLPWDGSSSHLRGPAEAPPLIRAALRSPSANLWSESLVDLGESSRWDDAGDLAIDAQGSATTARDRIREGVAAVLAAGGRPLSLGGDHSVTFPVVEAVAARHAGLTILHVDAHADLYDDFDGDRLSHACPFARIMEAGLAQRLVQVGIRTLTGHQRAQADRFGVEVIDMRAFAAGVRPHVQGPLYVSVDLDALDPAHAPGVSHWEPGGLTTRELLTMLQTVDAPIVGADVVEYNPRRDPEGFTAMVAAKVVKELLDAMLR